VREITTDQWDTEVWGAVHPSPTKVPRPRLFFYFGEEDHWIAEHTRDDLMRIRGRGQGDDDWKPWMEIDQLETPHAFCMGKHNGSETNQLTWLTWADHNAPIAEKVVEYVETIVKLDRPLSDPESVDEYSLAKNRLSTATVGSENMALEPRVVGKEILWIGGI
jgi:hypothetical protein